MDDRMQAKVTESILLLSAGTITYSWVQDATQLTSLVAAVIGLFTACLAGWFYFERALKMRRERMNEDKDRGKRRRTSVSDGDRDSVGSDKT